MLTTVSDFKIHHGISGNTDDDRLQQLVEGVIDGVKRTCRRDFESASRTLYLSGTGQRFLDLEERPVTAVASLAVDQNGYYGAPAGAFSGSNDAWTEGVDFALVRSDESEKNIGTLVAIRGTGPGSGIWPVGDGNIKVIYTAGYTTLPADLILACHLLMSSAYQTAKAGTFGPIVRETLGRWTYEVGTSAEAAKAAGTDVITAASILARYREPVV